MSRTLYLFAAFSLALAILCGCQAAGSLFNPDAEGRTAAGDALIDAGRETGIPWLGIAGTAVNLLAAAFLGKRAAAAKDAEDWTDADAEAMAVKMRGLGFKVERA